jgi:hypothetical protein
VSVLRLLWRILFVLPERIQKWIDRLLVTLGVLAFLAKLWRTARRGKLRR